MKLSRGRYVILFAARAVSLRRSLFGARASSSEGFFFARALVRMCVRGKETNACIITST